MQMCPAESSCSLQEVSLNSAKLSNLDLLNCGELRSLSCPELDQALSQQLVSPGPSAPPRRRPKVILRPLHAQLLAHCSHGTQAQQHMEASKPSILFACKSQLHVLVRAWYSKDLLYRQQVAACLTHERKQTVQVESGHASFMPEVPSSSVKLPAQSGVALKLLCRNMRGLLLLQDCLARRVNVDGCDKLPDAVATVLL